MLKKTAVDFYGSQVKLADVLGISEQAVSKWVEVVPEKQAFKLQFKTGGQLLVDESLYTKGKKNEVADKP